MFWSAPMTTAANTKISLYPELGFERIEQSTNQQSAIPKKLNMRHGIIVYSVQRVILTEKKSSRRPFCNSHSKHLSLALWPESACKWFLSSNGIKGGIFVPSTSVEQLSATSTTTTFHNVLSHLYCILLHPLHFLHPCCRHPVEHPYHFGYQYDYSYHDWDGGTYVSLWDVGNRLHITYSSNL